MPRRTYSDLGYTVFRARHVLPNDMVEILDRLAARWHVDRALAVDMILARWQGTQEGSMPPEQDPDYFAVTDGYTLLPVRQ